MRTSKYLNKQFGNWLCTQVYLAANYGHSTRHNAYRYVLVRQTSDGACLKIMSVSGPTMKRIATGRVLAETVAENKKNAKGIIATKHNEIHYKFI